jgi:hypothetical protein
MKGSLDLNLDAQELERVFESVGRGKAEKLTMESNGSGRKKPKRKKTAAQKNMIPAYATGGKDRRSPKITRGMASFEPMFATGMTAILSLMGK